MRYTVKTRTMLADMYTPVSAYLRLRDLSNQSILMESSDYHSGRNARSFIALNPIAQVSIGHGVGRCEFPDGKVFEHEITSDYGSDRIVNEFMRSIEIEEAYAAKIGLWGFTSFNAVRYFENIEVKDETRASNDAPDMLYVLFRHVLEFDHFNNQLVIYELEGEGESLAGALDIHAIEQALNRPTVAQFPFRPIGEVSSPLTDEEHKANIRQGIAHCKRGDVFQIVLSRRFVQQYEGDDFKLYRALRSINPSPYLFYMDFGGFRIFGSSPETHCRIDVEKRDGVARPVAYIDPIAGTTRRTGNDEQDTRNANYLRNDPKENAEHVMLVDLARNDLSRNCHHVKVDFYKDLQYYSHVIHLVSRVSGVLDKDADPVKTFIDTFPAGTLSGAPKVRAMQLISELEPHNRGAYGGCVGSISFDGSLNQAITIRTFVSRNNELWFQAGGGIVAKSDEEYELQEVNNKLGALRKAIVMAGEM